MEAMLSKQELILSAALQLFADRGFDGTTVPVIAEAANVGAGTIYRYFENKEALVNVLFQQGTAALTEATIGQLYQDGEDIRTQFRRLFYGMVHFAKQDINSLHFIVTHAQGWYLTSDNKQSFEQLQQGLFAFCDYGIEQKKIRALPSPVLIAIVFGAFKELYNAVRLGGVVLSAELIEQVEECCWNAIEQKK
ncbi:TetR/AcrR family transcriptional regulator [Paenibacillus nicotianae]|uniref:TetR/AcrR family transcriptional regulator n=1 Tax=Paenibacillus nicotianae TaxID=1526551 RepID=A0ABW4UX97_9BACL